MASDGLLLVEGTIEGLAVGHAPVNLLRQFRGAGSSAQGATAAIQAAAGETGLAAGAAMVAMYDGETMDHFAFAIEEDILQGVFPHVTFADGDEIKVVYEQRGEEKHVLAIMKPQDKLLWLPLLLDTGIGATFLRSMKHSAWMFFWMCIGFGALGFFVDGLLDRDILLLFVLLVPAFALLLGIWDFKDFRHRGQQATEIFRMLGFKNPVWLDLRPFSLIRLNHDLKGECIYRYDLAMEKQK